MGDIWLNLRPSSTVKGLRLLVTPFRKSCSEQDVRIQRYSHCNNDAGRCHNTELFCKQLVKCGTLDQESWDRACTEQFKESDGMQLPLAIIGGVLCDRHHLPRPRRQVALPALLRQPGRLQQHRHQQQKNWSRHGRSVEERASISQQVQWAARELSASHSAG